MYQTTPTVATLQRIPDGKAGVIETLRIMGQFAKEGKKSLFVRQAAMRATQSCNQKDYFCEARRCQEFVRDNIRYVQDIDGVETVATPDKTLESLAGDCDDKSTLLAAMLMSIGHPARYVAIGFQPGVFEHVYVETLVNNRWIPLESTEPVDAGWSPPAELIQAGPYRWHI